MVSIGLFIVPEMVMMNQVPALYETDRPLY